MKGGHAGAGQGFGLRAAPRDLTLSLETFASITRALWPRCSQVEAAAMDRAAFDRSHGRVDHAAFEAVMARHRVFTRCLNLPRFEGCGFANALADSLSTSLTTVVTRRLHFSEPLLDRIRAALPQPAAKRFSDLIQHLRRELGSASPTRGVRALCAYREVLRRALALRSLKLEVASSSEFLAGPDRYARGAPRGRGARKAGGGAPGARHCGRGRRHRRVSADIARASPCPRSSCGSASRSPCAKTGDAARPREASGRRLY